MSRIGNPSLEWRAGDVPCSRDFDDVYAMLGHSLAETRTVFLEGNNLPHAWQDRGQFTIAETGFGTGLNFLATWQLFQETAPAHARLDFISVEKLPLHPDDLRRALSPWRAQLGDDLIDRLLDVYPPRIPGFHRRWINDRVTLTLIFDDALRGLSQLDAPVDAWFLDGFSPKKNPQLWQPALFAEMARLSHRDTTLASFTAAGDVRRNLTEAGFAIKRLPGFRYKWHRITGTFPSGKPRTQVISPRSVTIIGAGLAGLALAHALKRRGVASVIHERASDLGRGASGNRIGLINPKLEAQDNPRNDAGLCAYSFIQHVMDELPDIAYRQTGSLHLAATPEKAERLQKLLSMQGWLDPHMRWVDRAETRELCGIALRYDGLFYPDAGSVALPLLLARLGQSATIRFNHALADTSQDITILCNGGDLHRLIPSLPLQPVRGQVSFIKAPLEGLRCPLMFGSYIAPMHDGFWSLGATFQQNDTDPQAHDEDDIKNIQAMQEILGAQDAQLVGHWSGIRTASRDRFPLVGRVRPRENLYALGALGSHGIQFSFLLAEILACQLTGAPLPMGRDALKTLSIDRFIKDAP